MKKILFSIFVLAIISYLSCVKDRNSINTDFGTLKPFLELRAPDFPGAGTPNFAGIDHFDNADIDNAFLQDTIVFYVNLASINTFNNPIKVTVGPDASLIKTFNDTSKLQYVMMPASAYKLFDKDVTIPANERVAKIRMLFKADDLDPTLNYMLPITILKNDGIDVSDNEGTVWFHKTGNCLAGFYDAEGTTYNYTISGTDTTLTATAPIFVSPKQMEAIDPKIAVIGYGNQSLAGWGYLITFDCASDSILKVEPNEVMHANIRVNSFTVLEPPTYDAQKKQFHFVTSYLNSSGGLRKTDETLTKQ